MLSCFELSALYSSTPDPVRRPGITPPPYTKHVLIWSQLVQLSMKTRCHPPPPFSYLGMLFIYAWYSPVGAPHADTVLLGKGAAFSNSVHCTYILHFFFLFTKMCIIFKKINGPVIDIVSHILTPLLVFCY